MTNFDITDTLAPASDQLDAIELVSGPRVFTVKAVSRGNDEQPINVALEEIDRPWRPSKGMRRLIAYCWGADASKWVGRRVELFFDPSVTFGKDKPGGTRIKRLSHIDGPKSVPLLVSRGKSAIYTVEPLPTAPSGPTAADVAACTDVATLRGWWPSASKALRAQIEQRVAALTADPEPDDHEADMLAMQAEAAEQEAER